MRGKTILKTFCVGLLLASVFGVAATGCSSTKTSATSSEEKTSIVVSYSVSVNAGEGVYASVNASSAVKGDTVKLTVVITDDNYDIKSVKVGSETLTGSANAKNASVYTYSYVVKDADVVFEVETYDVVAAKAHKIAYTDEAGLSHSDTLPTRADAGDEVTFNIATVSGYSVEGMSIYYMDGNEKVDVAFSGDSVTGYKFTMPDADVHIVPTVLGAYFKADFDTDVVGSVVGSYRTTDYTTKDFVYKMYVETGKDDDGNSIWEESSTFFARAGQKCAIARKHNYQLRLKDFVIDGKTVEADETPVVSGCETYTFVMGNTNSSVKAEIIDGAKVADVELSVAEVSHLDVELFTIDEATADDGTKTYSKRVFDGKWKYGETIYVSATAKEGFAEYEPCTIKATKTTYSSTYGVTTSDSDTSEVDWGYKSSWGDFTTEDISAKLPDYAGKTVMKYTPNANYQYTKLKVVVSEKNTAAFKESAIVKAGTFYGGNAYTFSGSESSPCAKSWSSSVPMSASGDGSIKVGGSTKDTLKDDYDGTQSLFTGNSGYKMFYDGGSVMAITYGANGSLTSDMYIGTNKISEADATNAKIKVLSTISGTTGAALFGFYNGDTLVDQCLAYYDANGTLHMTSKVTIVTEDADPFVKTAKVTVKDESGTVLAKFNITEDSGSSDTISSEDLGQWVTSDGSMSLYISDDNTCTYLSDVTAGTSFEGTYTYDAITEKGTMSTIGDWDGSNYFIFNDNGTLTVHLDDEYHENTVTLTMTKYNG
jgi:hypothetical protein